MQKNNISKSKRYWVVIAVGFILVISMIIRITGCTLYSSTARKEAMLMAAKSGEIELVDRILSKYPDLIHARDDNGRTALHLASRYGHSDVVQYLRAKGAKVDTKDVYGRTTHGETDSDHME